MNSEDPALDFINNEVKAVPPNIGTLIGGAGGLLAAFPLSSYSQYQYRQFMEQRGYKIDNSSIFSSSDYSIMPLRARYGNKDNWTGPVTLGYHGTGLSAFILSVLILSLIGTKIKNLRR